MAFAPTNPFNGAAMTGFTSPTYSYTTDQAPSINGKQFAIYTVGGTQVGVTINTVSSPFTVTAFRPAVLRALPQANPVTGIIKSIPMNQYKVITRKGMTPAPNQAVMTGRVTTIIEIPAGCDTYDQANVKALLSAHIGVLADQSSGLMLTAVNGTL